MDIEEKAHEFKVVIMGDSSIGKTSIVQRFNQETFDYNMDTTIGASFLTKTVQSQTGPVVLNVWDTAGQERYRCLIPTYARGSHAAIICYDVSSLASFEALERWIGELHQFCSTTVPLYIVGNKCDLQSVVDPGNAEEIAKKYNGKFMLTSAKTGVGIQDLFTLIANDLAKTQIDSEDKAVDLTASKPEKKKKCC